MNVLFGNFGNNTIALLQWAHELALDEVYVVHVDTGWAAHGWVERVEAGQALATRYGFTPVTLQPATDFAAMVEDRGRFPTIKNQWCAPFLKGLPLLAWLDECDLACEATILLGSRRADSRARADLPEFIELSEHYNERRVWHPLFDCDTPQRDTLVERAGFEVLNHCSLECAPCLHATQSELVQLSDADRARLSNLEKRVGRTFITSESTRENSQGVEQFDRGCGSPYACGE